MKRYAPQQSQIGLQGILGGQMPWGGRMPNQVLQQMRMRQAQWRYANPQTQQPMVQPQSMPVYGGAPQVPGVMPQKQTTLGVAGQDYRSTLNQKPLPADYWQPNKPYEY